MRDHQNHASPNSGWPEAAAAGVLGIQLGGSASYFGKIVHKPFIGAPLVAPQQQHILLVCRLALIACVLCLFFCLLLFSS